MLRLPLVAGVALVLSAALSAQEVTGSILGALADATGAPIPGAAVTVKSTDQGGPGRRIVTDATGNFVATLLPVGIYSLEAEAKGFKRIRRNAIDLHVGEKLTFNLTMEVGDVAQEIVVEGDAPQVQLQNATAEGLVNGTEVRELALSSRNFIQLLQIMPGVTSNSGSDEIYVGLQNPNGTTNTVPFAMNGGRSSGNSYMVDGADNLDRGSNLTLLTYPSVEAIAEFKAFRGLYSAEFGRGATGQINVITRSGANKFHASGYWFNRNDAYAANDFFNNARNIRRPPLRWNNYGYTVSGPVVKNKTFFFWSHEFRKVLTYGTFNALLPTADLKNGVFSQPVCVEIDGSTCLRSDTRISNINPVARAYISDIFSKLPNGDATTFNSFTPIRSRFNARQELVKIDHRFSEKLNVNVRWINDTIPTEQPGGLFTNSPVPLVPQTTTDSPGRSVVARFTHTISPSMFNEGGYAYSYGGITSEPIGLIRQDRSPNIKVPMPFPVTLGRVPTLTVSGFSALTGYGPYDNFNINQNFFDNFAWLRGKHVVKTGVTVNIYRKQENHLTGLNAGSFTFATTPRPTGTSTTNQAWANFLLGNVATFQQADRDLIPDLRQTQWEGYVQDDFRWSRNLTINAGVRFSWFPSVTDANHLLTNFDPARYDPARAPQINRTNGNLIPNTGDPLNGIIINDRNSPYGSRVVNSPGVKWAPRLGLAWDPFGTGKTAVRMGYGMSYDSVLVGIYQQAIGQNPPFVNNITINNTRLDNPSAGVVSVSAAPRSIRAVPSPFRIPYTQQWSFDIQRQFGRTVIATGYYGSKGTHLLGIQDINTVRPGAAAAAGLLNANQFITTAELPRLNAIRPYQGYQYISSINNDFNSNYHSLQVSGQRSFPGYSSLRLAYTFSKVITDSPTDRSTAPQNYYCRACDRARANFDRTQVLTLSYVYPLPWAKKASNAFVRNVAGGWTVSGIVSAAAGLPLRVTSSYGVDWAGIGTIGASPAPIRTDLLTNPNEGGARDRFQWFNTAAYAPVPNGQNRLGNAGATTAVGPGYQVWNLSGFKTFRFHEKMSAQFRAETYNTFNHTNWAGVSVGAGTTNFGQITSAREPRRIQLALKLTY